MNKSGLSPIVATILLIAFAVAIGAMIMSWTTEVVKEAPKCSDLPESILNIDSFCKLNNMIMPRVDAENNKHSACEDLAFDMNKLATC